MVFGTWAEGADIDGWHDGISNDDSYGIGIGVSGPLFPVDPVVAHERIRHHPEVAPLAVVEQTTVAGEVAGEGEGPWWKDLTFLDWVQKFVLALALILMGRHGEQAAKKGAEKVKTWRRERTTPSP